MGSFFVVLVSWAYLTESKEVRTAGIAGRCEYFCDGISLAVCE